MKKSAIFVLLFCSGFFRIFGQTTARIPTIEDYFTAFNDFSGELGGLMGFLGGIGLAWADPYIGHLINPIPHWGFGLTLGATTISNANLGKLNEGINLDWAPFLGGKQLNLMYAAEFRIGGFRTLPFDVGAKFGLLPALPLFAGGAVSFQAQIIGADLRWRINSGYGIAPKMSIGLEFNSVSGAHTITPDSFTIGESTNAAGTTASGNRIFSGADSILKFIWSGQVIDLKFNIGKSFPFSGVSLYGGAKAGVALTSVSWNLSGEEAGFGSSASTANRFGGTNFNTEEKRLTAAGNLEALLPTAGTVTFTTADMTILYTGFAVDLQGHVGISFDIDRVHISLSYRMDILHFESGVSLQFRYQQ